VTTSEWVNQCNEVSVLVITGAGSTLSAGGNIRDMANRSGDFAGNVAECADRYRKGIQKIPLALQNVEVPIIAAVNGPTIGAGFDLANMADIRIASQPPKAIRLTKRLMKIAPRMELKDFLDVCANFQGMCHNEPEHLETVNRMLEAMARK